MIAFLDKELRELLPLFVAILVGGGFWAWAHASQPLATMPVPEVLDYLIEDWAIFGGLCAFLAGHSRLRAEFAGSTIHFLDGLPTTRGRIFAVKALAGGAVVLLLTIITWGVKAWALTRWTGQAPFAAMPVANLSAVWVGLLLYALYGLGLALSWLGAVGWAALAVGVNGMLLLSFFITALRSYVPFFSGVVDFVYVDGTPRGAVGPPLTWATIGTLGLLLSAWLFQGPGERLIQTASAWAALIRGAVIAVPGCGLILIGGLSSIGLVTEVGSLFRPVLREQTEHFRFLIVRDAQGPAREVIAQAEAIRGDLVEAYRVDGPDSLDIEMTGASRIHGGQFIPGKIQLRRDADPETFAHELAHAWSHSAGGDADLSDSQWRFFEEGLASQVAADLMGAPLSDGALGPQVFGEQADWMLLFADGVRSTRFNPDEVYVLGGLFAQAIDEVGGDGAALCVARRRNEAQTAAAWDGLPTWAVLLKTCDMALDDVLQAYERVVGPPAPWQPDIAATVTRDGTQLTLTHTPVEEGALAPSICRIRDEAGDERVTFDEFYFSNSQCVFSTWPYSGGDFQVQLGYPNPDQPRFGPWHTVTIPR
ncbi:MAG: hypothetical protein AAFV53_27790 [Myxococcota bacterium]